MTPYRLTLRRDNGHNHVWIWTDATAADARRDAGKQAAANAITWHEAAIVTQTMRYMEFARKTKESING